MYLYMVQPCYPPLPASPRDGDGLKDDVYGGAVTQGKMMPRLPCGLGRDTIEGGEGCRQPACTIYIYIYVNMYMYMYIMYV